MPAGSSDNSQPQQQQQPIASAFPASNLYPNRNIWSSSISNARDRSIASKDTEENPSGSSALNNSGADVWGPSPWNTENPPRSTSTSPNRTRDGGVTNGSGFFDPTHAAIGMKKGGFNGKTFQDESNGHNAAYPPQKRSPQEASYIDSMGGYNPARDSNVPPSRQSQGSPAYNEIYNHGRSTSIQSQRPMPTHSASFQNQSANQRAFNFNNNQVDDDLSLQFARRMTLDGAAGASGGSTFNPASQPFQMNPGSQSWAAEAITSRFSSSLDLNSDPLTTQFNAMKRGSVDRISPGPSYRLEQGNSPRSYAPTPDPWSGRPSSRDPRSSEQERRTPTQYAPQFPPYYPNQYSYANFASQYPPNFIDPYTQGFRHPMLPGYGIPLHANYALGANVPIRPARDQDPGKGVRSVLLDEFRLSNKSTKRYELKDIYNYVVEFSGDQHGSRFIQQKLETANSDEKDQVFREIEPNAIQLMKDVFGNYVIQKFFEHGNQVQKKVLAEKMKGKVVDLSVQVYACRVVQKALEHVLVEQQAELTKELEPEIVRVIRDQNGNHVVQKIIELVPRQHLDFVMAAFKGHVTGFASHAYGCRVIQRMLEYGTEEDKAKIMSELHSSIQVLITDQYGNYVTQHVIRNGKPEDRAQIIQLVMSQLLTLSKHKFASNVVEKCIEHGSLEQRSAIREQLTAVGSDGTSPLQQMMRDQYGNYVLQKLLGQLEGTEREILVEEIKPQYFILKKNGASRQLQALEKLLELGSGGTVSKTGPNGLQIDSPAPTPPFLTNETNSPQSNGSPSMSTSAVETLADDGADKASKDAVSVTPQVQDNEV
ncbi:armadillo-type protein [Dactylonectria macrodidyma]|uniref:Pumilio homology domain family member 3 n=1 Tax=Dactylonectria macrodidyma TaxID=307937 RepID=A0A9P9FQU8_9HYPO|nr:armadillo-type protein [Dactylonectria macrodidyma]